MALIIIGVLIVFNILKFRVSSSQIAMTSSPVISGPNSPNISALDYQGLEEVLESYYKLQPKLKQFPSLQMHFS